MNIVLYTMRNEFFKLSDEVWVFDSVTLLNIVTLFILPKDKVQFYDLVSDQLPISDTTVGCILSMSR